MIGLLINLVIFVAIIGLVWWVITQVPLPQPVRLVVTVVFALIVIVALLGFAEPGFGYHAWR